MHYYLNPILNPPNKVFKIPKSKYMVKACKKCNTMLLRYSYQWVIQKDDLKEYTCPYCREDLEIIERDRQLVPVTLDFKSTNCNISGTNNQIGVIYNGIPVKLTIKVKALLYFLQNYQNLFENDLIGPLNIRMMYRRGLGMIDDLEFGPQVEKIEWRPVVLFPEDLIAF